MGTKQPLLLSTGPAAERLGVSSQTLRKWENDGLIRAVWTPGGNRRFRVEDLDALLAERPAGA